MHFMTDMRCVFCGRDEILKLILLKRLTHKYKNIIEEPAEYGVEKFEDILQSFQSGELFNIDRAWDILPEVISLLEKYPQAIHQAIIKLP